MLRVGPHGKNHSVRKRMAFLIKQRAVLNERQGFSLEHFKSLPHFFCASNNIFKFLQRHTVKGIFRRLGLPRR